jgi:hypothetical protein
MITWPAVVLRVLTPEIKRLVVNALTESIYYTNRGFRGDEVLQTENGRLAPVSALNVRHKELFRPTKLFILLLYLNRQMQQQKDTLFAHSDVSGKAKKPFRA